MIFNVKNTAGKKVKVYAYNGVLLKAVTKYNTKTREVELLILGETEDKGISRVISRPLKKGRQFPREVVKVKVKIPGSYIVVDGKKY